MADEREEREEKQLKDFSELVKTSLPTLIESVKANVRASSFLSLFVNFKACDWFALVLIVSVWMALIFA